MTRLVFHIGHRKTGSSSIQAALARGRITLPGKTLLYPARVAHNYLARHVRSYLDQGRLSKGEPGLPGLHDIVQQIRSLAPDYAILSGETFESLRPAGLMQVIADLLAPHLTDHLVLAYVRPHAGRVLSSFVESVKTGHPAPSPAEFHRRALAAGRFYYAPQIAAWQAAAPGHFVMRPFVRDRLAGGSVVLDFVATAFGADAAQAVVTPEPDRNLSLCIEDLMLVRLVQEAIRHRGGKGVPTMLGWELARRIRAGLPRTTSTRPVLHRSLAERIRRDYLEDARAMDRDHVGDAPVFVDDLDRAVDTAPATAQSYDPAEYYSPDALDHIRVLAGLIDSMLDNSDGKWTTFFREQRYDAADRRQDPAGPAPDHP